MGRQDPANVVMYNELSAEGALLFGGCQAWSIFASTMSQVSYSPKKHVNISILELTSLGQTVSPDQWVTCSDGAAVQEIAAALATLSEIGKSVTVACGSKMWQVRRCAGGVTICVNCDLSCAQLTSCSTGSNMLISPCTSTGSCAATNGGRLRILLLDLADRYPPPEILSMSTNSDQLSITQTATLSAPGSLACAAFPASTTLIAGISINTVLLQGFISETTLSNGSHLSDVVISGLVPSTSYAVLCVTQSVDGVVTSEQTMREQATVVTTECCKRVKVSLLETVAKEGSEVLSALRVTLDSAPTFDITVSLRCKFVNLSGVTSFKFPFFVSEFPFTLASRTLSLYTGLKAQFPGTYHLSFELTGTSAADYALSYDSQQTILTVLETNAEPPSPLLSSAIFSRDGVTITIRFNSPTNMATLSNIFTCSILFTFSFAANCRCQWLDSSGVVIYVRGNAINVGNEIKVRVNHNLLKAECSGSDCSYWKYANVSSVWVTAPAAPIPPVVSMSAPAMIGQCDALILDLSGSSGSGGRRWTSVSFTVQSSNPNSTKIATFLNSAYQMNPPTPIPKDLFDAGSSYQISATLCNFLNACAKATHRLVVSTSVVPIVSILGNKQITTIRKNALSLTADAYSSACGGALSYANLNFVWSVHKAGVLQTGPAVQSTSIEPRKFSLRAFTLDVNSYYTVTLTVLHLVSLKASSASVAVFVARSTLVAKIAGGSERAIKYGESLTIDGSGSYDDDYGTNADLSFDWSCVQVKPTYSTTCPLTLGNDTSMTTISVSAFDAGAIGATSRVTLRVYDSTREVRSSVDIYTVPPRSPTVVITSSVGKVNPNQKLKLSGEVTLDASGTVMWSTTESSFALNSKSLVPIRTDVTGITTTTTQLFHLVLAANALPERSSFTFRLTCTVLGGLSSFAAIKVTTNGPPYVGVLDTDPTEGTMLNTSFQLTASRFEDDDMPLSYEFGYLSGDLTMLVLQSMSVRSHASSILPAGPAGSGFALVVVVRVYDSLLANSSVTSNVIVHKVDVPTEDLEAIFDNSAQADNIDGTKRALATTTSTLNSVDCSLAPDCAEHNREECSTIANMCGACKNGYVGASGADNSPCVQMTKRRRRLLAAITEESDVPPPACGDDADCDTWHLWSTCKTGRCERSLQSCPRDCNGRGHCVYRDSRTYANVTSCYVGNPHCEGVCLCEEGFTGAHCFLTVEEATKRKSLRQKLLTSLRNVTAVEDVTSDSVLSWISTVKAVTSNSDELSQETLVVILDVCYVILTGAETLQLPYETLLVLFDILNSVLQVMGSLDRAELEKYNLPSEEDVSELISMLGTNIVRDMVIGQTGVEVVQPSMRVAAYKSDATSSVRMSSPQTVLEKWMGTTAQTCDLNMGGASSSASADVVMIVTPAGSRNTPELMSNPVKLILPTTLNCASSDTCKATFVMQNNMAVDFKRLAAAADDPMEVVEVECIEGSFVELPASCPFNYTARVKCNGTAGVATVTCPRQRAVSTCRQLLGDDPSNGKAFEERCEVVAFTATNTTCVCSFAGTTRRQFRRLQDNEATSNHGDETVSVEFASMLDTVWEDFTSTWSTADNLSANSVEDSWQVLVTTGCVGMLVVLGVLLGYRADKHDALAVSTGEQDSGKTLWGGKRARSPSNKSTVSPVAERETSGMPSSKKSLARRKSSVFEMDLKLIDESLPQAISSKPFSERFAEETKKNHRWLGKCSERVPG